MYLFSISETIVENLKIRADAERIAAAVAHQFTVAVHPEFAVPVHPEFAASDGARPGPAVANRARPGPADSDSVLAYPGLDQPQP